MMGGSSPHGFTIIETLIVLTISGLLVASAILFVSNKQSDTEFTQSVNQFVSNLNLQIGQVVDGSYNSPQDFNCSQSSILNNTSLTINYVPITSNQGSNAGCQLLGDVFEFNSNNTPNKATQYSIFPVASNQYSDLNSQAPISSINEVSQCSISPSNSVATPPCTYNNGPPSISLVTTNTLAYGLRAQYLTSSNPDAAGFNLASAPMYRMIAFYSISHGGVVPHDCTAPPTDNPNNALTVSLIPIATTNNGASIVDFSYPLGDPKDVADIINGPFCPGPGNTSNYALNLVNTPMYLCLADGNQYALVTIGGSGNPTSVESKTESSSSC